MKPTRKQRSVAFEEMAAAMDKLDAELEALTERLASMSPEERRTYLEAINASWIAIVQKKEQLAALMTRPKFSSARASASARRPFSWAESSWQANLHNPPQLARLVVGGWPSLVEKLSKLNRGIGIIGPVRPRNEM